MNGRENALKIELDRKREELKIFTTLLGLVGDNLIEEGYSQIAVNSAKAEVNRIAWAITQRIEVLEEYLGGKLGEAYD